MYPVKQEMPLPSDCFNPEIYSIQTCDIYMSQYNSKNIYKGNKFINV